MTRCRSCGRPLHEKHGVWLAEDGTIGCRLVDSVTTLAHEPEARSDHAHQDADLCDPTLYGRPTWNSGEDD